MKADMTVTVDPRIELLSVVWRMSGYGRRRPDRISRDPSPYADATKRWFRRCAKHETIRYFREQGLILAGDLPVALVLHLSKPPEMEWRVPCDPALVRRVGGVCAARRFADALRAFARDSAFADFFHAQQNYYKAISAGPVRSIRAGHWIEELESYAGSRLHEHHVILAPLLKSVAFGPRVRCKNGGLEAYSVLPAQGIARGRITFRTGRAARSILLHEFAHSIVNPLVERHRKQIARSASLMRRINYKTCAAYGAVWGICVGEHIVRAITTRISARQYGETRARKELVMHEKQGFLFMGAVCDWLREYERCRRAYPSFLAFFPVLLTLFEKLATASHLKTCAALSLHPPGVVIKKKGARKSVVAKKCLTNHRLCERLALPS